MSAKGRAARVPTHAHTLPIMILAQCMLSLVVRKGKMMTENLSRVMTVGVQVKGQALAPNHNKSSSKDINIEDRKNYLTCVSVNVAVFSYSATPTIAIGSATASEFYSVEK